MKLDDIWGKIETCPQADNENIIEMFWVLTRSPHTTFGDIQPYIEKWSVREIEQAFEELSCVYSMEAGEDYELTEEGRHPLVGHGIHDLFTMSELSASLWRTAKPKKKKFF